MFGLTFDKLLIVAVIAAFLLGPERLPTYAAKLGKFTRSLRDFANGAKSRMRDEMGPEFDEVDWKKLDPRQYDPRRIIREALLEDDSPAPAIRPTIKPVSATMADAPASDEKPASETPGTVDAADAAERSVPVAGAADAEPVVEPSLHGGPPVMAEPVGRGAGRYDSEAT